VSSPQPLERRLLADAEEVLTSVAGADLSRRLDVLEGAAAVLGGCSIGTLRASDQAPRKLPCEEALFGGDLVRIALQSVAIHPSLALASLAQPSMSKADRRRTGAYYTDFRLAQFLARQKLHAVRPGEPILDPASGTGSLLIAVALELGDQRSIDRYIGESVHAADLSAEALRGLKLAFASLTGEDEAVEALATRLRQMDSLLGGPGAWKDLAPHGFRSVIGNPPWERLKLTRHEYLAANGVRRHYGADYGEHDFGALGEERARIRRYVDEISALYGSDGTGERDLYELFLTLAMELAAEDGEVAMLVPAGLIRSQGTEPLRRHLLDHSSQLQLAVVENKARFFAIDARFKFLALHVLPKQGGPRTPVAVGHGIADDDGLKMSPPARLGRSKLRALRPDLTIPEVRGTAEWRLFCRMAESGDRLGALDDEWPLDMAREVDMTNDRWLFSREELPGYLPLIEGRMVHQLRSNHKAYVSGTGRGAVWRVTDPDEGDLVPQFWVDAAGLSASVLRRTSLDRIGFCDITGQTNERTMLAARVPAGVVCGNKVPTITFERHRYPAAAADLWLAVANSFAFDWLLRRSVTTTVNYFVLRGVPFPSLSLGSRAGRRLVELSRAVTAEGRGDGTGNPSHLARWRAEMDALVFRAYGLVLSDVRTVLDDFPLLDRGQVPLPGESRSTVTRDLALETFARLADEPSPDSERRLADAQLLGATAYAPAQASRATVDASLARMG
jgi:hypothetical protein